MKHYYFSLLIFAALSIHANAQSAFPQGFENITNPKGEYFVDNPNFAAIELANNPLSGGINTSAKVAAVIVYPVGGGTSSGIIRINFEGEQPVFDYPENPLGTGDEVPVYYDRLRFKYYSNGALSKNVELEPNGSPTSPKTLVQPGEGYHEEWSYVVLPLEFKSYTSFQIRVNRNEAGSGSASGTAEGGIIYVDDFELYNSVDGPSTSVKLMNAETATFNCINTAKGSFRFETSLDKEANVKVDLISIDGRTQTIYNQSAQGNLEIPFNVSGNGIYLVRLSLDGVQIGTRKIVSK